MFTNTAVGNSYGYDFNPSQLGPLMGGPQCRLSILRKGYVHCQYFRNFPLDFKIVQCRLSILRNGNVHCQ